MKKIFLMISLILGLLFLVGCNEVNETINANTEIQGEINSVEIENNKEETIEENKYEMGEYITLNVLPGMSVVRFKMTN